MVGVPHSNGCQLCVKRRVKCDEARPGCWNCSQYGAECPGYDRLLKFVTGKHPVRPRRAVKMSLNPPEPASAIPAKTSQSTAATEFVVQARSSPLSDSPDQGLGTDSTLILHASPQDNRAQFICTMIDSLYATHRNEILFFAPWFSRVSPHLGHKVTLDSAMSSLMLHMLGKVLGDSSLVSKRRLLYGQSLVALQQALNHSAEWKTSETLCATMILAFFEVCTPFVSLKL